MTTIAACVEPDTRRTWIGCDSRVTSSGGFVFPEAAWKVQQIGRWFIGVSGSHRSLRLVWAARAEIEKLDDDHDAIAELIYDGFAKAGYQQCTDHGGPPCYEQHVLLVTKGRIYHLSGNGTVSRISRVRDGYEFFAIGSGSDFALGAMHSAAGHAGNVVVRAGLDAASAFDMGTGGTLSIAEVE